MEMRTFCRQITITSALLLLLFCGITREAAAAVTATDNDTLRTDVNSNGAVNRGDTIRHTVTINSIGTDATGMNLSETIDANTTLAGTVSASPVAVNDTFPVTVVGNIAIDSAALATPFSVTANDFLGLNLPATISAYDSTTAQGGQVVMTTSGTDMGKFTYNPPAGFEGTDTFTYTLSDNAGVPTDSTNRTATVTITVSGMIWFVKNDASACTAVSAGCGRLSSPFTTLAALNTINNGTGSNPAAGDNIFIYYSATNYTGPITLLNNQKLIGQGATASLQTITGLSPQATVNTFPATGGNNPTITSTGNGVVLANGNTLRGFSIGNSTNTALSGSSFGTLTLREVLVNTTGAGLSLTTGTADATFTSFTSTGGTKNISLTSVGGTINFGSGGALSGATGESFLVSGGTVATTYGGDVTQGNNAAMVSISGGHATGTITFQTGTLSATNGTGLQFDNADGTYTFNGTTTLNGGDAGIDIFNGSSGNFSFATGTTITNPSGTAFTVTGSAPAVTFSGSISKTGTSAGLALDITNQTAGTITFQTGTITNSSSNGTGINLSNVDGTVNFNGTTTLSNGNNGIDILNGSGGNFNFATGTTITNPSGTAFTVTGSAPAVTYSGSISKTTSAGLAVDITNQTAGTITFQTGTITNSSSSGTGISLTNVDGTVNFNGTTTLSNGNNGIDILNGTDTTNGSQGTINFGANAAITDPSGAVIDIQGSKPTFTYSGSFSKSVSGIGINAGNNQGGSITINGTGTKSLSTSTANAIYLDNNDNCTIAFSGNNLDIDTTSGAAFTATNGGTVTVTGTGNTITTTTGTAINVANTTIGTSGMVFQSINAGTAASGPVSGIILNNTGSGNFTITGNAGSCTSATNCTGGAIQKATGPGMDFTAVGGAVSLSFVDVENGGNDGIRGNTISGGFTLNKSRVAYNGDAVQEDGLRIRNLLGTSSITNSIFEQNQGNQAAIMNDASSALILNVTGSSFKDNDSKAFGLHGFVFAGYSSSNMTLNLQGCTFAKLRSNGFYAESLDSATVKVEVQTSTFDTIGAASINIVQAKSSSMKFNIHNNTKFVNNGSHVISINQQTTSTSGSTLQGMITNNNIGTQGSGKSATTAGSGIRIITEGQGTTIAKVDSNTIDGVTEYGIMGRSGVNGVGNNLQLTATNNTVRLSDAISLYGIFIKNGVIAGDQGSICADIKNNTASNSYNNGQCYNPGSPCEGIRINQYLGSIKLPGYTGGAADDAAVKTFLQGQNTSTTALVTHASGSPFSNVVCTQPVF